MGGDGFLFCACSYKDQGESGEEEGKGRRARAFTMLETLRDRAFTPTALLAQRRGDGRSLLLGDSG